MKFFHKNIPVIGVVILIILLIGVSFTNKVGAESFQYTDATNDVLKITYVNNNTLPVIDEGQSKGEVDITKVSATVNKDTSINSTVTITFSGTPVIDAYHFYSAYFNFTATINTTHYVELAFTLFAGAWDENLTTDILIFYDFYNETGPVYNESDFFPLPIFGIDYYTVQHSISGNSLFTTFMFNDTTLSDLLSNVQSITLKEMTVVSMQTNVPFWDSLNTTAGVVLWYDVYPDSENPYVDSPDTSSNTANDNTTDENGNDTAEDNPLASLASPGFELSFSFLTLTISATTALVYRKKRKQM